MGARPVAMLSDIHVADDGDVAKIFDHIAGITTVSELTGIPLVTGSTLGSAGYGNRRKDDRRCWGCGMAENLTARIQAISEMSLL